MTAPARAAAILGLFLLMLIGLWPPVRRPADFPFGSTRPLGSRAFLLSGSYDFTAQSNGETIGTPGADIDGGRLLAEALAVGSATAITVIGINRSYRRPGSGNDHRG